MSIDVRPEQPEKALYPISVTLLGMVTDVRPEHDLNASFPIDVTLLGMVTDVRPEHELKAPPVMIVVPSFMVMEVFEGIVPLYLKAIFPIYIKPSG